MAMARKLEPTLVSIAWIAVAVAAGLATAFFTPPTVVGVSLAIAAVLVTTWKPEFGVAILLLIVPLQRTASSALSVWGTNTGRLIVLAVVAGWLAGAWFRDSRIEWDLLAIALAIHIAVLGSTFLVAKDITNTSAEVYRWGITLPAYLLAFNVLRGYQKRSLALWAIAIAVALMAAASFWQVATGAGPPSFELRGIKRAYGSFGQPNPLAAYFEMSVPLLLAVSWGGLLRGRSLSIWKQTRENVAFAITGIAGLVALLLTQSRGGLLGMATAMFVMAILIGGWARRLALAGCTVALVVLLMTPTGWRAIDAGTSIFRDDRSVQITVDNFAVEERLAHWRAAINMAEQHPLLGVGAGNFNARFREFTPDWRFRVTRGHAHNAYLHELAEAGLIGLTSFFGLFAAAIYRLRIAWQRAISEHARLCVVGVAGITSAVIVHNMFDYLHGLSLGLQLAIVLAMATAIAEPAPALSQVND